MVNKNNKLKRVYHYLDEKINFDNFIVDWGDIRRSVLVVGAGRSGTTYFANLINNNKNFRYIFEPFHPKNGLTKENIVFYSRPDQENEEFQEVCRKIFEGRIRSPYVDQYSNKHFYTDRIVKSIRLLLSLEWFGKYFPEVPIIYIMRHPLAIVNSRLNLQQKKNLTQWSSLLYDSLYIQKQMVEDFLEFEKYKNIVPEFDKLITYELVISSIVMKQLQNTPHMLVYYENSILYPEDTYHQTISYINEHRRAYHKSTKLITDSSFDKVASEKFKFPSTSGLDSQSRLSGWCDKFDSKSLSLARSLFKEYGMEKYYDVDDIYPATR